MRERTQFVTTSQCFFSCIYCVNIYNMLFCAWACSWRLSRESDSDGCEMFTLCKNTSDDRTCKPKIISLPTVSSHHPCLAYRRRSPGLADSLTRPRQLPPAGHSTSRMAASQEAPRPFYFARLERLPAPPPPNFEGILYTECGIVMCL